MAPEGDAGVEGGVEGGAEGGVDGSEGVEVGVVGDDGLDGAEAVETSWAAPPHPVIARAHIARRNQNNVFIRKR